MVIEAYAAARGGALHRTAFVPTVAVGSPRTSRDHAMRAAMAWRHIDGAPDANVRRVMVNTYAD